MAKNRDLPFDKDDSRLRILYLYQMLQRHTDESHALSTRQIMEMMEAEHGITMHRTTLPKDVEVLRAAGIEVMSERKRTMYYYLSDRPLSLPELRLLIDAVLSSKFITEKKSQELVDKLISLTSETSADKLRRTVHVTGKAKSDNEKGYYIVDAINDAIHLGKKISFYYFDYDGKKKHSQKSYKNGILSNEIHYSYEGLRCTYTTTSYYDSSDAIQMEQSYDIAYLDDSYLRTKSYLRTRKIYDTDENLTSSDTNYYIYDYDGKKLTGYQYFRNGQLRAIARDYQYDGLTCYYFVDNYQDGEVTSTQMYEIEYLE